MQKNAMKQKCNEAKNLVTTSTSCSRILSRKFTKNLNYTNPDFQTFCINDKLFFLPCFTGSLNQPFPDVSRKPVDADLDEVQVHLLQL